MKAEKAGKREEYLMRVGIFLALDEMVKATDTGGTVL